MKEEVTPGQAEKLLRAIFDEKAPEDVGDGYPGTVREKVDYAEYVLAANLGFIGKAINRLSRLNGLLAVTEKDESGLPPIILHNELRMALEPLLWIKSDINEIAEMLVEVYKETKGEAK